MAFSTNMVVLVVATGILAVAWWRSRREKFETPEERKQRKIREAEARYQANPGSQEAIIGMAAAHGSQPVGYLERARRKLGLAPPRDIVADVVSGYSSAYAADHHQAAYSNYMNQVARRGSP